MNGDKQGYTYQGKALKVRLGRVRFGIVASSASADRQSKKATRSESNESRMPNVAEPPRSPKDHQDRNLLPSEVLAS